VSQYEGTLKANILISLCHSYSYHIIDIGECGFRECSAARNPKDKGITIR